MCCKEVADYAIGIVKCQTHDKEYIMLYEAHVHNIQYVP